MPAIPNQSKTLVETLNDVGTHLIVNDIGFAIGVLTGQRVMPGSTALNLTPYQLAIADRVADVDPRGTAIAQIHFEVRELFFGVQKRDERIMMGHRVLTHLGDPAELQTLPGFKSLAEYFGGPRTIEHRGTHYGFKPEDQRS